MRAGVADTHAATEVAKLYNAAYTYQQLDAKTAAATLSQLKALWQKPKATPTTSIPIKPRSLVGLWQMSI